MKTLTPPIPILFVLSRCKIKDEYRRQAQILADRSQEVVYSNPHRSPINFSEPTPAHDHLKSAILEIEDPAVRSSAAVLDLIARAKSKVDGGAVAQPGFREVAEEVFVTLSTEHEKSSAEAEGVVADFLEAAASSTE